MLVQVEFVRYHFVFSAYKLSLKLKLCMIIVEKIHNVKQNIHVGCPVLFLMEKTDERAWWSCFMFLLASELW